MPNGYEIDYLPVGENSKSGDAIFSACNFLPGAGRNDASADKILQIRLKPNSGTDYDYNVLNEKST